jgi:hypothetical protein
MAEGTGTFVWYELMTTDTAAAETFYRSVIGWGSEAFAEAPLPYSYFTAQDGPVAGLMTLPPEAAAAGARPGWVGYVHVDDLQDASERLEAAGGTVHKDSAEVPTVGRFAMVADPQGAHFVLFQPEKDQAPAPFMTPGHGGWHELHAADGAAAFEFYAGQFGWAKDQAMDMGPMGTYQLIAPREGGNAMGAMMTSPNMPRPAWLFYFVVESIAPAIARIEAGGGTVLNGPMEVPGGAFIVQAQDPQGAMFALVAAPNPADSA